MNHFKGVVTFIPGSYPFATCFICHEKGHLTNSCPDNPKGLYPHGTCDDKTVQLTIIIIYVATCYFFSFVDRWGL